ncbi:hypothetical protein DesfrDRAFT_1590 [Solidesulfovibrio fructosivorans JJ]]|uniref:Uncharacterized protein n=1 Tax=Solidesulfovibrio fructosivorans JJ] TaxID=596151 RepID=E1JVE1_SOLFR|nr:hypothetical protein [Solidesulfovibrio fructosivorans]EFL51735.1 hypothetical protein DesfrDRAFT_1590 [Solidesulfovibrio fructosivorans JJ]]
MTEHDFLIAVLVQTFVCLLFLLVGWRLGRESAGLAMFERPFLSRPAEPLPEDPDPWAEAALGMGGSGHDVDSFLSKCLEIPAETPRTNNHHEDFI